jgi:hypothetical protein
MVSLRGGSSFVSLIAAAALALGACGGDDKADSGTTGAGAQLDQTTNTGTGDTGTTGTTTRERTSTREGTTTRERTSTRERSGSGGGGSNGSGSKGGSDSGTKATPALQPGNVEKTAKAVCTSFLPKQIEKDLEDGDRKPESVAKDYSRGFPEKQQKDAYDGCLAGLKSR